MNINAIIVVFSHQQNANKGKCLPRFNRMMPTCRLTAELDGNAPQYQVNAHASHYELLKLVMTVCNRSMKSIIIDC